MKCVEHETALNRRDPESRQTAREVLTYKARRGNLVARAKLVGPPYPSEFEYLDRWSMQLYGRSGIGAFGAAPLSYSTIRDWSELTGNVPSAMELDALFMLDAVRNAPDEKDEPRHDIDTPLLVPAWPSKDGAS